MTGDDPGHASVVAEQLAQADDEDLEAAGIDTDERVVADMTDTDLEVDGDKQILAVIDDDGELTPVDPRDHGGREAEDTEAADEILREALLEESNCDPNVSDVIDDRYTTAVADGSEIMGTLHLEGQEFDAGVRIDVQRLRDLVDLFEREFDEDQRHAFLSFVKHEGNNPILTALRPTGYDQDAAVLVGPNGGDRQ